MSAQVQIVTLAPVISQEQFSVLLGVTKDTVRGWVQSHTLPVVKIGKQNFINLNQVVDDLRSGKDIFTRGDYE